MIMRAPYRFITLSQKVYRPDWGKQVSHDVPFEDGISGTLKVRLTNHSPLLVSAGSLKAEGETRERRFHCYGSERAIPGSSIRGMLRNVLEVAAFGKIGPYLTDQHLSIRDLQNPRVYVDFMTERDSGGYKSRSKAGFLEVDENGAFFIRPCQCARVKIEDLEKHAQALWGGRPSLGIKQRSPEKYKKWGHHELDLTISFDPTEETRQQTGLVFIEAHNLGKGRATGQLVFTGQPAHSTSKGAKKREFIFYEAETDLKKCIDISAAQFQAFTEIHSEGRDHHGTLTPNAEWKLLRSWLGKADKPKVPVFYIMEGTGTLRAFGLAQMFRLPYKKSLHDAARTTSKDHFAAEPDLAELIFGRVVEKTQGDIHSLRGRVSIEPLWQVNKVGELGAVKTVLGAPKPSFYPFYVSQPHAVNGVVPTEAIAGRSRPKPNYKTLMDEDSELGGWKRYPVRGDSNLKPIPATFDQNKVASTLVPLGKGAQFEGVVHLHNLRKIELGALLWVMTWGGNSGLRHSLGMGKAFGYGQVSLEILSHDLQDMSGQPVSLNGLVTEFTKHMEQHATLSAWQNTEQIWQLLDAADPTVGASLDLRHPVLEPTGRRNEFKDIKENGYALPTFGRKADRLDRHLYKRLSLKERRELEEAERQLKENNERKVREAAEQERKSKLGPAEIFREAAAGKTEAGSIWDLAIKHIKACRNTADALALWQALHENQNLAPSLKDWFEKERETPKPGSAEFKQLNDKRQDKAKKLHDKIDLLRSLKRQAGLGD